MEPREGPSFRGDPFSTTPVSLGAPGLHPVRIGCRPASRPSNAGPDIAAILFQLRSTNSTPNAPKTRTGAMHFFHRSNFVFLGHGSCAFSIPVSREQRWPDLHNEFMCATAMFEFGETTRSPA